MSVFLGMALFLERNEILQILNKKKG
jgi:hypothetical protein